MDFAVPSTRSGSRGRCFRRIARTRPFPLLLRARLRPRTSRCGRPLPLDPASTLIVLPAGGLAEGHVEAAELAAGPGLRKAAGAENRLRTASDENKLDSIRGKTVLALGGTRWLDQKDAAGLSPAGYAVRRDANVVTFAGGKSMGVYYGAVRFLDDVLGVRFYCPPTSSRQRPAAGAAVPRLPGRGVNPFVISGMMTGIGGIPGDGGWAKRNGVTRRLGGTHQHNFYELFDPARYAKDYPSIYPLLDGRRHVPADGSDQGWPALSLLADLVEVALQSAVRHFRKRPAPITSPSACRTGTPSASATPAGRNTGVSRRPTPKSGVFPDVLAEGERAGRPPGGASPGKSWWR